MSREHTITIHQGEPKNIDITVEENGAALDLTGKTVRWVLATRSYAVLADKTEGSGLTVTDAANGVFRVALDANDTAALEGRYYHEAEVDEDVVVYGPLLVLPRAT